MKSTAAVNLLHCQIFFASHFEQAVFLKIWLHFADDIPILIQVIFHSKLCMAMIYLAKSSIWVPQVQLLAIDNEVAKLPQS